MTRRITTGICLLEREMLGDRIKPFSDMTLFGPLSPDYSWERHADLYGWLGRQTTRFTICVAFGTQITTPSRTIRSIVQTALDEGSNVVLACNAPLKFKHLWPEDRVYCTQWVPQRAVLAHSATRALVTHGGANSMLEALWFGKPALVIPRAWDQFYNGWLVEQLGFGLCIGGYGMTRRNVARSVSQLIRDEDLHEAASELSHRLRANSGDRSVPAFVADWLMQLNQTYS